MHTSSIKEEERGEDKQIREHVWREQGRFRCILANTVEVYVELLYDGKAIEKDICINIKYLVENIHRTVLTRNKKAKSFINKGDKSDVSNS